MEKTSTIITTFAEHIYIIKGMTPDEVSASIGDMDEVRMPNGSRINRKAIASIQSYEDYQFQTEQKQRHKKGQFLKSGQWYDQQGMLGINAHLERVTGEILLNSGKKK